MPTLSEAKAALLEDQEFWNFMEPVILALRAGSIQGWILGYRTKVEGRPRVRVRLPGRTRSVEVDWKRHGESFNDSHYIDILHKAFLDTCKMEPDLYVRLCGTYDGLDAAVRHLQPRGTTRFNWWHPAMYELVRREVGNNARHLCSEIFAAAVTARDDPREAKRLVEQDKGRKLRTLRNSIRGALEAGISRQEISGMIDTVIVESVMDG